MTSSYILKNYQINACEIKSQLNVAVLCLLKITLNLSIEYLLVCSSDKNVFEVNFCFLIFGNVLLVLCAIWCDYMCAYFFWTFAQYLFFNLVLFLVLLIAILALMLFFFLNGLLLDFWSFWFFELFQIVIIGGVGALIFLFLIFLDYRFKISMMIVVIFLLMLYFDLIDVWILVFFFVGFFLKWMLDSCLKKLSLFL